MYARCTIVQGPPDSTDQAVKVIHDQVLPLARQLDGFKGVLSFLDRDSGKGISFTLWDSDAARAASVEAANQMRSDMAQQLDMTVLGVENYELVIDERID